MATNKAKNFSKNYKNDLEEEPIFKQGISKMLSNGEKNTSNKREESPKIIKKVKTGKLTKIMKRKAKKAILKKSYFDKLKKYIAEFTAYVGQQVVVVTANSSNKIQKIFGSQQLKSVVEQSLKDQCENAVRILRDPNQDNKVVLQGSQASQDIKLCDLPPISVDGKPTTIDRMNIKNMKEFILTLLKYTSGIEKLNWTKPTDRPEWWPKEIRWATILRDTRPISEKEKIPFSEILRNIIINCYKFYNRQDILNASSEIDDSQNISDQNNNKSVDIHYNFINESQNNNAFKDVDIDFNSDNESYFDDDGKLMIQFNNELFDTENGIINVPVPLKLYNSITQCSQKNPNRFISVTFNEKQK